MANTTGMAATARKKVKELIGRVVAFTGSTIYQQYAGTSVDRTQSNYAFWDSFRRCKAVGYELAGLFAVPIAQIISGWVLGKGVTVKLKVDKDTLSANGEYTQDLLNRFLARVHGVLTTFVQDLYSLGDQYIIVNLDGSISIASPEMVDPEEDELDYRKVVAYTITTKLDKAVILDRYTEFERTITVKTPKVELGLRLLGDGYAMVEPGVFMKAFPNLIGKIPIVHFANDRSANEIFGRPIFDGLLYLYKLYNLLLRKMAEASQILGNPIPTFEGMTDIDATIEAVTEPTNETWVDPRDGEVRNRLEIAWDKIPAIFVGAGGSFNFKGPEIGFTNDVRATLKSLFLMIMEYTRIPEGMWGSELGSARNTFGEQMRSFEQYIVFRRSALAGEGADEILKDEAKGGLLELLDIWLSVKQLTDPKIERAPIELEWEPLSQEDAELLHKQAVDAFDRSTITAETFNKQLPFIDPKDAKDEAEAAQKEAQDRMPVDLQNSNQFDNTVNDLKNKDDNAGSNADDGDARKAAA